MSSSSLVRDLFDETELGQYEEQAQQHRRLAISHNRWWMLELKDGAFMQHHTGPPSVFSFESLVLYVTVLFILYHLGRACYHLYFKSQSYTLLYDVEHRSHLARLEKQSSLQLKPMRNIHTTETHL